MTSVLVTGATGFIGSWLTTKLVEEGYDTYCLVRHVARGHMLPIKDILDKVRLIEGDLTEYHSIRSTIRASRPQIILHLGALTPVKLSFTDPFPFVDINFLGTVNIVHSIIEESPKTRLIAASTAEVYGYQKKLKPFTEDLQLNPASPYAVSKAAADMYIRMSGEVYSLRCTILRPTNTYGRQHEIGFIVEYLITNMLKGLPVYIGTPDSVRDYMYIEDHVNAYLKVMGSEKTEGEVFNVSTGIGISNRKLAEKISLIIGYAGKIIYGSYPPGYPQRPTYADPPYLVLDNSKVKNVTGWSPKYTLNEGLKETFDYLRQTL